METRLVRQEMLEPLVMLGLMETQGTQGQRAMPGPLAALATRATLATQGLTVRLELVVLVAMLIPATPAMRVTLAMVAEAESEAEPEIRVTEN